MLLRPILLCFLLVAMLPWGGWSAAAAAAAGGPLPALAAGQAEAGKAEAALPTPHRCRIAVLTGTPCGPDVLPAEVSALPPPGPVVRIGAPDPGLFGTGLRPRGALDPPRFG